MCNVVYLQNTFGAGDYISLLPGNANGGAISADVVDIKRCNFTQNVASSVTNDTTAIDVLGVSSSVEAAGGAVVAFIVTITESEFDQNSVESINQAAGGAVLVNSNARITSIFFCLS